MYKRISYDITIIISYEFMFKYLNSQIFCLKSIKTIDFLPFGKYTIDIEIFLNKEGEKNAHNNAILDIPV